MTPVTGTTTGARASMDMYLDAIGRDALLSAEEERSLAQARERGDSAARSRLIRANLRLVVRIARSFQGRGLPMDDLVGEGNLGLIRAVEQYDPSFGVRFGTYASYWIKQAIREALNQTAATIRLPSHMIDLLNRWRRCEQKMARRLGRPPRFEEVGTEMQLTEVQRRLVERALTTRKMVTESGGENGLSLEFEAAVAAQPVGEALETGEQIEAVKARLARLEERERVVIALRFGLDGRPPLTLRQVGDRLGITREWVRKIEQRAVQKLSDGQEGQGCTGCPGVAGRARQISVRTA